MNDIKEVKGIKYRVARDFPIAGVNFVDLTPTLIDRATLRKVSLAIVDLIKEQFPDFDYIVAPDARGFIWGSYISALVDKGLIPIRKHGKLPDDSILDSYDEKTEYSSITLDLPLADLKGKKCIFVDDVYATGGTYHACTQLVEKNGGEMLGAFAILDIELSNDQVNSLIKMQELDIMN